VFTTRYLDIFTNFVSPYNTVMKVVFLITTYGTLYLVFLKFKATYDSNHDTFRAEFLVIPAAGLAVLVNHEFSLMEVREERVGGKCLGWREGREGRVRKCGV
jgi:ER lumen protein retaining receptor